MKVTITYGIDSIDEQLDGYTFEITGNVSAYIPATYFDPAEGGEVENIEIECISKDIKPEEKQQLEERFKYLIDLNDAFRETIELLLFENAESHSSEDWYD